MTPLSSRRRWGGRLGPGRACQSRRLVIPGIGPVLGSGIWAGLLAGGAAGGVIGGMAGASGR